MTKLEKTTISAVATLAFCASAHAVDPRDAKNLLWEATEKSKPIEAVAKRIAKGIPVAGYRYVTYGVYRGYDVEKNGLGIPLYKYRTVRVVVQAPGEAGCRGYDVFTQSDYEGGGRFGPWYFRDGDGLHRGFPSQKFSRGPCR